MMLTSLFAGARRRRPASCGSSRGPQGNQFVVGRPGRGSAARRSPLILLTRATSRALEISPAWQRVSKNRTSWVASQAAALRLGARFLLQARKPSFEIGTVAN
jgi:hypothetical protein